MHGEDAQIVEAVRAGDTEAFRILVERHQDKVYGVLRRLTNDPDRAEELAQEAFMRAYQGIESFRGDSQFGTWLVQIAVFAARDFYKRERRAQVISLEEYQEKAGPAAERRETRSGFDPFENLSERELVERLERAMKSLPRAYLEVFTLRVVEELEYEEIAQITGDTVGSLKVRLHRTRIRLKQFMEDGPPEDQFESTSS
jgi:RNA polymerase sigma-70 factor (ECF subfamily)